MLSRVWLFATPWTVAHWAPLSMGFPRQEQWSGLPFPSPGDLPDPGMETMSLVSSALASGFLTAELSHQGSPHLKLEEWKEQGTSNTDFILNVCLPWYLWHLRSSKFGKTLHLAGLEVILDPLSEDTEMWVGGGSVSSTYKGLDICLYKIFWFSKRGIFWGHTRQSG